MTDPPVGSGWVEKSQKRSGQVVWWQASKPLNFSDGMRAGAAKRW